MRVFIISVLTSLFFLTFIGLKAQELELISETTTDALKSFINKNSVALRSVQKNSMKNPNSITADNFKNLLKLQLVSVKQYQANKAISGAEAYKLREECISYLSKNTTGSTDYYKITNEEKSAFGSQATVANPNSYLSENEIKSVESINISDPALFNAFTITLQ